MYFLRDKTISWACFEASGLNKISYLHGHCNILDKSSLGDTYKEAEWQTTEKTEVSSAKGLAFEVDPSRKWLIYTKNNNGPRIEPCEIASLICTYFELWPLE